MNLASSPIELLLPYVADSLARVAPERKAELLPHLRNLRFEFVPEERRLFFEALADESRIRIAIAALEYLWVISYCALTLQKRLAAVDMEAGSISFADDPETQAIPTLLGWAMRRINPDDLDAVWLQWPTDTPKPETWPEVA